MPKGIVIAGTSSGVGKTTVALGLMAALGRRGLRVTPFKVGPDFIDPGHHRCIANRPSINLDGWMLSEDDNRNRFMRHAADADVAVVEGVMGLFDGIDGRSEDGSTAQMAKWLGLPVLLVIDAQRMARSVAAMVLGFSTFDPDLAMAGVIFNRIGSPRHRAYLEEALAGRIPVPCLGGIPREAAVTIPERHLGLVTSEEFDVTGGLIARLAELAETHIGLDRLIPAMAEVNTAPGAAPATRIAAGRPVRIGVARDGAFCFYYPDNLALLSEAGSEPVGFSPLDDSGLPPGLDGLYFGGGYPEVHAVRLAANRSMREAVRAASMDGMPIYGECGGFMYLGRELSDRDERVHPMTGCLPVSTRMCDRLAAMGYREVRLGADAILGRSGTRLRGHEFHYSEPLAIDPGMETVFRVAAGRGGDARDEGYCLRRTLGSYVHLHFGSHPASARAFVDACRAYRREKEALG